MDQPLLILLPLLALILAGVSIAGLWYWWSSGQEEETVETQEARPVGGAQPQAPQPVEPTVGDMVGKVTSTAQSWIANIARAASTPAAGSAPAPGYAPAAGLPSTVDGEMVEVLRVLRDLADGRLVIEIGGKRYWSLAEIIDPQVRRRFMGNAQALAQFAQVPLSPPSQATTWPDPAPETIEQPPLSSQPVTYPPPPQSLDPSFQPAGEVVAPLSDLQEQPGEPKTMADEIEELIQLRLRMTPALMYRAIHIRQGAGGGIRVEVDGRYYDSVVDVADPEVAAFLQSVIREWEARQ